MMVLNLSAGAPLKYKTPPRLLRLVAFHIYAIGRTFYWPTVLGFVSEQFPKGGAMTLNTLSAMGMLTVGVVLPIIMAIAFILIII